MGKMMTARFFRLARAFAFVFCVDGGGCFFLFFMAGLQTPPTKNGSDVIIFGL